MEFQNQPFQDLKARVVELEQLVAGLRERVFYLEESCGQVASDWPTEKPPEVRKEPDDARRKSLLKTVGEIQKTDATGS